MPKLIVANWKLNAPNLKLWGGFRSPKGVEIVICPPFTYLGRVRGQGSGVKLGAQDCFWEEKGAYTGEVAPGMLKKLGVEYVIVGHSERRRWLHETDEMVNKKVLAALRAGLKVILCVGEPTRNRSNAPRIRSNEIRMAKNYVGNQLRKDLKGIENWKLKIGNLAIAYEPIWAIGTGRVDKPEDSAEMARFIKSRIKNQELRIKVLYGGSVTSKNVKQFLMQKEIDGALVGGASLKVGEFSKIIKIASKTK